MTASSGPVARFPRHHWRGQLRRLRPVLLAVLAIAALGGAAYAIYFSSWLAADRVEVHGGATVSDRAVVRAAAVDPRTPLARVDLDAVDARVSKLAGLADVVVHRSWPHTIMITVKERQPVATLYRHGSWQLLDKEGVPYRTTPQRSPELTVVQFQGDTTRVALQEIGRVVTALPTQIRSQLKRVEARSMDSIRLVLRGNREVMWGSAAESDRKAMVLLLLLKRPATVYDVSVPEQPTTSAR